MIFDVNTLTIEQLKELIRSGDDSHHNQLRITGNGKIFLSSDVGADNLDGIMSRFETFDAGNGYVGEAASQDSSFIKRIFKAIQDNIKNPSSYIDIY